MKNYIPETAHTPIGVAMIKKNWVKPEVEIISVLSGTAGPGIEGAPTPFVTNPANLSSHYSS